MHVSRSPYKTNLHAIVRENYRQVFFDKEITGIQLPFHLEREFKKYLTCGILSYGMARFHCPHCYKDKMVAFSCKGRTICPSCTGRRTADTAKHLLQEVIPEVPVRQWVLSMPYIFRFLLASRPEFLRKALGIYHRNINSYYIKKAKQLDLKNPKVGAITVIQRFGGSLNLNVHFHTLYTDGVFHENYLGQEVFYEIIPSHEDVLLLTRTLKKRFEKLLSCENEYHDKDDHSLNFLQSQSVQNKDENFFAPVKIGKYCDPPIEEFKGTRCGYLDGFSLHANVKILKQHRSALEGLCRYILRSPLSNERILYNNGKVFLKLKRPYNDGTSHLQFTPEQFIKRIISIIPPPRQNLIRYTGVFGARHKKRKIITSMVTSESARPKIKKKIYRTPWAELLKHVFKYDVSSCDNCGTKLVLVASITSSYTCNKILTHLKLPIYEVIATAPRGPPEIDLIDQFNYEEF
jgi:hypothetical protein